MVPDATFELPQQGAVANSNSPPEQRFKILMAIAGCRC